MKLIEIQGYKILLLKVHIESETLPNPDEADDGLLIRKVNGISEDF